jgi:hypothetical protein
VDHIIEPPTGLAVERILDLLLNFERRLLGAHIQGQLVNQIVDAPVVVEFGDASSHHHGEHIDYYVSVFPDQVVRHPAHVLELLEHLRVFAAHYVRELRCEQEW